MYVFQVMDHYCGSRFVSLIAVLECVVIAWFYGKLDKTVFVVDAVIFSFLFVY